MVRGAVKVAPAAVTLVAMPVQAAVCVSAASWTSAATIASRYGNSAPCMTNMNSAFWATNANWPSNTPRTKLWTDVFGTITRDYASNISASTTIGQVIGNNAVAPSVPAIGNAFEKKVLAAYLAAAQSGGPPTFPDTPATVVMVYAGHGSYATWTAARRDEYFTQLVGS